MVAQPVIVKGIVVIVWRVGVSCESPKYSKTLEHCNFIFMTYNTALGESLDKYSIQFLNSHLVLYISYELVAVLYLLLV